MNGLFALRKYGSSQWHERNRVNGFSRSTSSKLMSCSFPAVSIHLVKNHAADAKDIFEVQGMRWRGVEKNLTSWQHGKWCSRDASFNERCEGLD